MTFPQGTPSMPDILETVAYVRRVADSIVRNNPLTDAVVSRGLIRWEGNYASGGGTERINLLWIGEFNPADTNLPGSPSQRGFSLVRDDSRGGVSALAMFDSDPSAGGGLRQQLFITSGDGDRLFSESRQGGWRWPEETVPMCATGEDVTTWPVATSASYATVYEGRLNVVGNHVAYRVWGFSQGGATGSVRVRVEGVPGVSPDVVSADHSFTAGSQVIGDALLDVSAMRGYTVAVRVEAKRDNAVGTVRVACISLRSYSAT